MTEHLGGPQSISYDRATGELVLHWWRIGDTKAGENPVVTVFKARIPITEIPEFLDHTMHAGMIAVIDAGKDLAYGDCDRCGNRRLVDVVRGSRTAAEHCPDCATRSVVPFENVPRPRKPKA